MSDSEPAPPRSEVSPEPERVPRGFLQTLIAMEIGPSVTVSVGGVWLAGEITSERHFLHQAVSQLSQVSAKKSGRSAEELANGLKEGAFQHLLEAVPQQEGDRESLAESLFLVNAAILPLPHSSTGLSLGENVVRVRIRAIDALFLGRPDLIAGR